MYKKKKNLIILETQNLSQHIKKRLEIDKKFKNIAIVCWNLLPLINYKIFKQQPKFKIKLKNNNYINILKFKQLFKKIKNLDDNFFYINNCKYNFLTFLIEFLFKYKNAKKILLLPGSYDIKKKYLKKSFFLLKNKPIFFFKKIFLFVLRFISDFIILNLHQKPKLIFVGNNYEFEKTIKKYNPKKVFKFNSPEYENYLSIKKQNIQKKNNIVYIDQKFYGLDAKINNYDLRNIGEKEIYKYYSRVNFFLDKIKKRYRNHNIQIAAHPRQEKNFTFFNKKVFFNKTLNLIKSANLVIGHSSLAIKYAVLFKKPIILLRDYEFHNRETIDEQDFLIKQLGISCFDIQKKLEVKNFIFINIDYNKYEKFTKNFINFKPKKDYGRFDILASVLNKSS